MIEDKKIENLFKDNQHKLDEMPSPMAWNRLEVRLEKRHLNRKQSVWRKLSVAAAVFIAVSMIGLWTYINPLGSPMNKTAQIFPTKKLASEIIASDAPAPAHPLLMSHREKVQYLTEKSKTNTSPPIVRHNNKQNKIPNIPLAKSVSPKIAKVRPQGDAPPVIATPDMTVQADVEPLVEEVMDEKITKDIAVTHGGIELQNNDKSNNSFDSLPGEAIAYTGLTTTSSTTPVTTQITTGNVINIEDEMEKKYNDSSEDLEIAVAETKIPEQVVVEEAQTTSKQRSASKKPIARPSIEAESAANPAVSVEPELDRFDWLLGKWTDEDDSSFEEWRRIAPNILEGKGYFVVDVDTTFTQSMQIIHSNAQVFFMVDGQLVEGKFELQKYDDQNAVFKNKDVENEQITLKKDAKNVYSVTIEKSKKQAAREKRKKKRKFRRVNE